MSFAVNIADEAIQKHALVILKPRARVTGWTQVGSSTVWYADVSDLGPIARVWATSDLEFEKDEASPTVHGHFWHDQDNDRLYVKLNTLSLSGSVYGPDGTGSDPGGFQDVYGPCSVGMSAEFELYFADDALTGPSDPLDADSPVVDWLPVLERAPVTKLGDRISLYGFSPIQQSSLEIENQDGFLTPLLYAKSFKLAVVRSFILADSDLERGVANGNVQEIFRGYAGRPSMSADGMVSIPCSDPLQILNSEASPAARFSVTEFPLAQPEATVSGSEWFIRRVRGMVENHVPVNVDFSLAETTSNNRKFVTHEGTGTAGNYTATVDFANGGNSGTRTYLTTTPYVNVGDDVVIVKGGVTKYAKVTTISRAAKYFEHSAITGTFGSGDTITRFYIGWVKIKDSDGIWWNLVGGRDYTMIDTATLGNNPDWKGFRLADNFEAALSFPGGVYDPSIHEILCRVYGTDTLDKYPDGTTDVGAVTQYGGVASQAVSILYWMLIEAGIPEDFIDQASFVAASSHSLGIAIPQTVSATSADPWRNYINLVLQSMIWKLDLRNASGALKVGITATAPFTTADFDADDQELRNFSFEIEDEDIYNRVQLIYAPRETTRPSDSNIYYGDSEAPQQADTTLTVAKTNHLARDHHLTVQTFSLEGGILQYVASEAQKIADRYSYALGDRRAFYSADLGAEFVASGNLGSSWNISRKQLPGYAFDPDTDRTRQTALIEVQKSSQGVTLVLEDQKGIQDNSGNWS